MASTAVFVVSAYTSYGLLVYLSVVGFQAKDGYHYIWEPGFVNARMFVTKSEAKENAEAAVRDLLIQGKYMIHKYIKKADGQVVMSLVS